MGAAADRCDEGVGAKCYKMSTKCNDLSAEVCLDPTLWDSTDADTIRKKKSCSKWAKIQPDIFNGFADQVCGLPTKSGTEWTESEKNKIKRIKNKFKLFSPKRKFYLINKIYNFIFKIFFITIY